MKELHPLCSIFPKLSPDMFLKLKDDIRENGLQDPIVLFEGKILDGQNRYLACLEIAVEPEFVEYDGIDPVAFVISKNLTRRHLSISQRSLIAAELVANNYRHEVNVGIPTSPTKAEAADLLEVSRDSVQIASKVIEKSPELAGMVREGHVSLNTAEQTADMPKKQRDTLIAQGPEAVNERTRKPRTKKNPEPQPKEPVESIPHQQSLSQSGKIIAKWLDAWWPANEKYFLNSTKSAVIKEIVSILNKL